jgi:3-methyladenine DNA glycosylase/8-oxoguanine DNA glycosylase
MPWTQRLALRGGGGEPVDLLRTLRSHGVADLPPIFVSDSPPRLETTLRVPGDPRTVIVEPDADGGIVVSARGRVGKETGPGIVKAVRHILRLDEDLSGFYSACSDDPDLAWAGGGAGRMIRSQTVFEDVVKTICTTNCAWSATERMVRALVERLGEAAPGAPPDGVRGRAFPTAEAMAEVEEDFYRTVVRAGYRSAYLTALSRSVASGEVDIEALGRVSADELPDEELESRLVELPGIGPYGAAHIMMMLGRYSRLILDSWTRPTYLRLAGHKRAKDSTIVRRWRRYGDYAGLAFWLYLTRGWVGEEREGSPV